MSNKKYGPMIVPNKAKGKEVKALAKKFPSIEIPKEIRESNGHCYVLLCVNAHIDQNGSTIATLRVVTKDVNSWEALGKNNTNKAFNCNVLVILHEPVEMTEETTTEEKKETGQSPAE